MIGKQFIVVYDWGTFPIAVHEFDSLDEAEQDRRNYPDPETYPIYSKVEGQKAGFKDKLSTLFAQVSGMDMELTRRLTYEQRQAWNNDGVQKFVSPELETDYTKDEE